MFDLHHGFVLDVEDNLLSINDPFSSRGLATVIVLSFVYLERFLVD